MLREKKKVVIFGAGGVGRRLCDLLIEDSSLEVSFFVDNDTAKHGENYKGVYIHSPKNLIDCTHEVYIGTLMGFRELAPQLDALGLSWSSVNRDYVSSMYYARRLFVERFSELRRNAHGCVAEAGVYRGEFASEINKSFPSKKLFLFDTFEGFDQRDFEWEEQESLVKADHFSDTAVEKVLAKMPFPENIVLKKGFFPETTSGIDEDWLLVSLDMDLYKPTLEGLKFFYPRMVQGGVLLIHDFFTPAYPNIQKAVSDFENEFNINLSKTPIGDDLSLAIIKT